MKYTWSFFFKSDVTSNSRSEKLKSSNPKFTKTSDLEKESM